MMGLATVKGKISSVLLAAALMVVIMLATTTPAFAEPPLENCLKKAIKVVNGHPGNIPPSCVE